MVSKLKLFVLVGAVAGLALSPACKKESEKKDGDKSAGDGKEKGSSSASSASALAYIPASANIVFGMNLASASNAPVLAKYKDMLIEKMAGDAADVQKECGLNMTEDIANITVGMVGQEEFVAVISGNFDQAKIEGCLTAAAKKDGKEFKAVDEGKFRVYDSGDGEKMAAYWPKANTAVLAKHEHLNLLNDVMAGKKLEGDVLGLIKSTKTTSTIWAAGKPGDLLKGAPVKGVDGFGATIDAGDSLDVKALINFADEAKAKEANGMAGMGIAMVKGQPQAEPFVSIIDKLKMEQDGKAMKIGISLSAADLELIEKNAGGMMR